jgi:hypothetical protein
MSMSMEVRASNSKVSTSWTGALAVARAGMIGVFPRGIFLRLLKMSLRVPGRRLGHDVAISHDRIAGALHEHALDEFAFFDPV